jgi:hypothetical protein
VKLKEPDAVGVPEIVPAEDNVRPPGNAPALMLQLYGWVPPLAASVVEYAVPTCPDGTEAVVICSAVTAAATVRVNDLVAVSALGFGVVESVTFAAKLKEPDTVGVPEIVPAEDSVRPPGNAPESMLQLYGVVPPLAASVVEYAVPTCPDGTDTVLICTGVTAAATVMLIDFEVVCGVGEESLTRAVKGAVPATVGVPLIWPVEAFNPSPVGSDPEGIDHEYGAVPPVAARVAAKVEFTCPEGNAAVAMARVATAGAIVTERDFEAVRGVALESLTCRVNAKFPDCVGVPLMLEPALLTVTPPGRFPEVTDHV